MTEEELRQRAEKIARDKVGFQVHFGIYLAVNAFLIALWYFTSVPFGSVFPWFIFPLFGWGIGIVGHFIAAYRGEPYIATVTQREYEKLRRKQ